MNAPLDEQYLTWLYSQVGSVKLRSPSRTYWSLLRRLYVKEFVWIIPNDDNRLEDGRELRYQFLEDAGIDDPDPIWMGMGCSMLEMMVALSRRLAFETEGEAKWWFWKLIANLGLERCSDSKPCSEEKVDETLDAVIWRTYAPNGQGGLFPLRDTTQDQRDVEIWYQLNAYLLENE